MQRPMLSILNNQKGVAPILLLVGVIGIIAFLAIAGSAPFKTNLLSTLFPKDSSHAAGTWAFEENWDLGALPGTSAPINWSDPRWDTVVDSNDLDGVMDGQSADQSIAYDGILEMGHGPM